MKKMLFIFSSSLFLLVQLSAQSISEKLDESIKLAATQYRQLAKELPDTLFPRTFERNKLVTNRSQWWTSGFFPAGLWYLNELTGEEDLKVLALRKSRAVEREKFNLSDHDIGFKIYCPFGNALRITGDSSFVPVIIDAARTLSRRFDPTVGLIRSWGSLNDRKEFLVIIDNMMNLELLFAATRFTGDSSYYRIAVAQADNTIMNHFREDGSSYHVLNYDQETGKVLARRTAQGLADSSAWSRGQSWGLYGYTVCYRETKDPRYLAQAVRIAEFMLTHPSLPKDGIPLWDMDAPRSDTTQRDASAASIMASALLELSAYVMADKKEKYMQFAERILAALSSPKYRTKLGESGNFLLKHGVGHLPAKSEVDVPLSYGDYYYLEAIYRWKKKK